MCRMSLAAARCGINGEIANRACSTSSADRGSRVTQGSGARLVLLVLLVLAAAASAMDHASAADVSSRYGVVICTSEAKAPWTLKARGTLTRTRAGRELIYRFESPDQAFDWRFVASREGHTTVVGPGYLMERFNALPKQLEFSSPSARRQSVEATGEIREYAGPNALALLIRANCPGSRRNPTDG